ncbi:MAG: phosphopantetheine-binding protein [Bacteroidota bacterium]
MARLQYPIWEKALRASGVAEEDIPKIVEKMKKAYVSWNENAFPGLLGNVISGRITNRFDLGGINSVVDAACAASLSAIKMALSELVEGRCDMMLTGGVDTDNSPFMYMSFSKTPAFSKSGNIRPFSDQADGMLIGEGIGMLVLKRLEDAERDGDNIYAVIKGVGTSSDGRFKSVYAPRPSGQALAMNRAYEDAGYAPSSLGLIEAHGTGTGAGDPTEFSSMQMVFGADNPKKQHIALGSVKSQIGHTKSAAGAAGIIKAVLSLHHKVLPPTINVEKPNSKFNIEDSPIYINTEARPWLRNGHPRRAGVSAFGFGGINVHITLEEYEGQKQEEYRLHEPYKAVLLQAATPTALYELCQSKIGELKQEEGQSAFEQIVQASKSTKLIASYARIGFVVSSPKECEEYLTIAARELQSNPGAWNHPKGIYYRPQAIDTASQKVAALFAGQGSQYVGMGKELANAFPIVAKAFQDADTLYELSGQAALSKKIFPIPVFSEDERKSQQQSLTQTQFAQAAIGSLSMGQYNLFKQAGLETHFTAGHSFGELTALWAAGVYDEATFLSLAKARGEAMAAKNPGSDPGTMLAVKARHDEVQKAIASINSLSIANVNSQDQVIVAGGTPQIKAAEKQLSAQGFSVIPLAVSAAFHTDFVKHAQEPFSAFVAQQSFKKAQIPVYSNTTAKSYPANVDSIQSLLQKQMLHPVLFKQQVENLYQAGARIFIEFGPKGILTRLVKNILQDKEIVAIAINANAKKDSDLQLRQAVIQMQVLGLAISHIDPYKKELAPLPPKSKLTVKLSGNNYVSPATQKAYQDTLNDGFKVQGGQTKTIEKIVTVEKIVEVPVANTPSPSQTENEEEIMNREILELIQSTLASFKANQTKSLEIFERFMDEQNKQSQQLLHLLSETVQATKVAPITANAAATNGFTNNTAALVSETPAYTNGNGNSYTSKLSVATPVVQKVVEPAVPSSKAGVDHSQLSAMLLEVVSEKTGYPAEMLELSMDMEADLGIDSIKRVEIFGALTQKYPELSGINPNELTELRTLGEIVDYVGANGTSSAPTPIVETAKPEISEPISPTPSAIAQAPAVDNNQLSAMLLEVVSEKTGYPAEMLELSMDMEADLGIDSIKRVEIFGALTQKYPELSGINPNELTELRTLGEIVDYVGANGTSSASTPIVETAKPEISEPVSPTPSAVAQAPTVDNHQLSVMLLEVVSEKTGYPAEMLELSMDMEADLGIDSIKRVEIFGALTQKYPELSGINPNELTELRTLGEIVDYVGANGTSAAAPTPIAETTAKETIAPTTPTPSVDNNQLSAMLLEVVSEKTGYPAEMLELSMDMEADLGIDSIKRVEIFGALTQKYPELSGINPNELTELRTLGEIVDYVGVHAKKKVNT